MIKNKTIQPYLVEIHCKIVDINKIDTTSGKRAKADELLASLTGKQVEKLIATDLKK